mgnify:CR=1 FL=1
MFMKKKKLEAQKEEEAPEPEKKSTILNAQKHGSKEKQQEEPKNEEIEIPDDVKDALENVREIAKINPPDAYVNYGVYQATSTSLLLCMYLELRTISKILEEMNERERKNAE